MCFQVLQFFFEYRWRPWTETILKFVEKFVFAPFSWLFYLLLQHYQHLKFFLWQSVFSRLLKESTVSSALDRSLVLFKFLFSKKLNYFDKNNFPHFRALLKQKGQTSKKIVNSRNFIFTEDFNGYVFSGPRKNFWVQWEALNRDKF